MVNNGDSGLITSDVLFGYLITQKIALTVYLEDGTTLTGIVLGRDDVFLLLMENTILRMIQIAKIIHLHADVNFAIEDLPVQLNGLNPKVILTKGASAPQTAMSGAATGKVIPPGPGAAPVPSSEGQSTKENFKNRLDQLVRNW